MTASEFLMFSWIVLIAMPSTLITVVRLFYDDIVSEHMLAMSASGISLCRPARFCMFHVDCLS